MFEHSLKQNHFTFVRLNNYKLFILLAAFSLKLSDLIHTAIRKGRNDRTGVIPLLQILKKNLREVMT